MLKLILLLNNQINQTLCFVDWAVSCKEIVIFPIYIWYWFVGIHKTRLDLNNNLFYISNTTIGLFTARTFPWCASTVSEKENKIYYYF